MGQGVTIGKGTKIGITLRQRVGFYLWNFPKGGNVLLLKLLAQQETAIAYNDVEASHAVPTSDYG